MADSSAATDFSRPTNSGKMRRGKKTMSRRGRTGRVRVVMLFIWAAPRTSATGLAECDLQPGAQVLECMGHGRHAHPCPKAALAPHHKQSRENQERPPDHQAPSQCFQ